MNCTKCGKVLGGGISSLKMHEKFCGNVAERFWPKVDKSAGPDACWPYTGSITSHGYGCTSAGNDKVVGAHKMAYLLAKGPVAAGLQVMHSCDNPPCCNPAHLSLGTASDNAADKAAKGRGLVGRKYWKKLTAEQVMEIRRLRGLEPSGTLAKRFDVDQPHIINIWNRRVWREVP